MANLASFSNATRILVESAAVCETHLYHEKVAQRIAELREEIRTLKNCHNLATPVCRLPPSIMSKIFLSLLAVTPRHPLRESVSWFRVSHVCVQWRSVALACGDLWASLRFVSPSFTEMMLHRAGESLLDVVFLPRHKENPERFYNVLKQALSRPGSLRTLKLRTWDNFDTSLNPFASTIYIWNQAPFLRTLALFGNRHNQQIFLETSPLRKVGGAPGLQHLHLQCVGLHWKSIPLGRQLQFLHLRQNPDNSDGYYRPSVEEFVSSFKAMSHLESLYLEEYTPYLSLELDAPAITRLLFPALHHIEVADSAGRLSQFFRLIEVPSSSNTCVRISDTSPAIPAIAKVLREVKEAFQPDSKVHAGFSGLRMAEFWRESRFCFYSEDDDLPTEDTVPPLAVAFKELREPVRNILPLLDSQFGLSTISSLHVALGADTSRDWMWFQRLPIKTLQVDSSNFVKLLNVWGQESPLDGEATENHEDLSCVSFFALSTLICRNVSFMHPVDGRPRSLVEGLVQVLQKRAKLGYPLAELDIAYCWDFGPREAQVINQSLPDLKLVWSNNYNHEFYGDTSLDNF